MRNVLSSLGMVSALIVTCAVWADDTVAPAYLVLAHAAQHGAPEASPRMARHIMADRALHKRFAARGFREGLGRPGVWMQRNA